MRSNETERAKYPDVLKPGETWRGVAVDMRPVPRGRDREAGQVLDVEAETGELRSVFRDRDTRGLFDPEEGARPGDLVTVTCVGTPEETMAAGGWRSSKSRPAAPARPAWGGREGVGHAAPARRSFKWEHWPLADVLAGKGAPAWLTDGLLAIAKATAGVAEGPRSTGLGGSGDGPTEGEPGDAADTAPAPARGRSRRA